MMNVYPIEYKGHTFIAVSVQLPKTHLMAVKNDIGYIMCGALDVKLLNEKLADRHIVAGRATGVKTIDQLMEAPLESVTLEAEAKYGITKGTIGKDALVKMVEQS